MIDARNAAENNIVVFWGGDIDLQWVSQTSGIPFILSRFLRQKQHMKATTTHKVDPRAVLARPREKPEGR